MGKGQQKKLCPDKPHPEAGPSHQTKPQPQLPPPAIPSTSTLPPPTFPLPKITLQSPPQRIPPLLPLSPQQEHFFHKHHRPYKIPQPRSQSAERAQPSSLARTPSHSLTQSFRVFIPRLIPWYPLTQKKTRSSCRKKGTESAGGWTFNWTNAAGSGFVLGGAGSSWGLQAPEGTKAAAQPGKNKQQEYCQPFEL